MDYYPFTSPTETKKDGSPLALTDCASHNIIMNELGKTSIPIASEEETDLHIDVK